MFTKTRDKSSLDFLSALKVSTFQRSFFILWRPLLFCHSFQKRSPSLSSAWKQMDVPSLSVPSIHLQYHLWKDTYWWMIAKPFLTCHHVTSVLFSISLRVTSTQRWQALNEKNSNLRNGYLCVRMPSLTTSLEINFLFYFDLLRKKTTKSIAAVVSTTTPPRNLALVWRLWSMCLRSP